MVIYEEAPRGGARVVECSRRAAERGIRPGLPLAEAVALANPATAPSGRAPNRRATAAVARRAPGWLSLELHDPVADRTALERLAAWCERFAPLVGLEARERPESLLLDVTGCERYFHGEARLVELVAHDLRRLGLIARVALADTVGTAWGVSHFGLPSTDSQVTSTIVAPGNSAEALAPLPVAALRLPPETLQLLIDLGIERIEQLQALPREALPARFGPELLTRWDQALGIAAEVIVPHRPLPPLQADWSFETPTGRRDVLEGVLAQMLEPMLETLNQRRQGISRLEARLYFPSGEPQTVSVGLFRPSVTSRHLLELLRLQMERLVLSGPVSAVRLRADVTAPLEYRQQTLFETAPARQGSRQWAALLDRLSNRLGRHAVARARLVADAQPEYAYRYEPLLETAPPGRTRRHRAAVRPSPLMQRPMRLRTRPLPIEVWSVVPDGPLVRLRLQGDEQRIGRAWGPERIETGWWRGRPMGRDYYRVETATGHRYWLFRRLRDGQWFLHGWFD